MGGTCCSSSTSNSGLLRVMAKTFFNRDTGEHEVNRMIDFNSSAFWKNFIDGSPSRKEIMNKRIRNAEEGIDMSSSEEAIRLIKLG